MLTALLPGGSIVHASEYDNRKHSLTLACMDPQCKAPVVYVEESERASAHFKTVGKSHDTRHKITCGFFSPLDVVGAINKVAEYQQVVMDSPSVPKHVVTLNLKKLDPDLMSKTVEKKEKKEEEEEDVLKAKAENKTPSTINTLKGIVKLLSGYEPDILASIYFNVGGRKLPMSEVILSPIRAYDMLWEDRTIRGMQYFIYGKVVDIRKLEKVMYIDLESLEGDRPFTVVIFANYFQHFKLRLEELKNKDILVFGELRKNEYKDRKKSEIIIKSHKYIELIKRNGAVGDVGG